MVQENTRTRPLVQKGRRISTKSISRDRPKLHRTSASAARKPSTAQISVVQTPIISVFQATPRR